jgi:putative NADPH-quinone reductase
MKHLVVAAHPVADSFTMGLAHAYATELEQLGHSQRTYDLYRMGFNPVLAAQELAPVSVDHPISADVVQAQDDIRRADVLTVLYPLWWLSMPAMMKGYIDRVFARGFAYESHNGIVHGLLSGKKSVLITVSGAPLRRCSSRAAIGMPYRCCKTRISSARPGSSCSSICISTRLCHTSRLLLLNSTCRVFGPRGVVQSADRGFRLKAQRTKTVRHRTDHHRQCGDDPLISTQVHKAGRGKSGSCFPESPKVASTLRRTRADLLS